MEAVKREFDSFFRLVCEIYPKLGNKILSGPVSISIDTDNWFLYPNGPSTINVSFNIIPNEEPVARIRSSAELFMEVVNGSVQMVAAVISGKIKVSGSRVDVLKLAAPMTVASREYAIIRAQTQGKTPSVSLIKRREEWQPDGPSCTICGVLFRTLIRRRHHCRFCGSLCCANCAEQAILGQRSCVQCCQALLSGLNNEKNRSSLSDISSTMASLSNNGDNYNSIHNSSILGNNTNASSIPISPHRRILSASIELQPSPSSNSENSTFDLTHKNSHKQQQSVSNDGGVSGGSSTAQRKRPSKMPFPIVMMSTSTSCINNDKTCDDNTNIANVFHPRNSNTDLSHLGILDHSTQPEFKTEKIKKTHHLCKDPLNESSELSCSSISTNNISSENVKDKENCFKSGDTALEPDCLFDENDQMSISSQPTIMIDEFLRLEDFKKCAPKPRLKTSVHYLSNHDGGHLHPKYSSDDNLKRRLAFENEEYEPEFSDEDYASESVMSNCSTIVQTLVNSVTSVGNTSSNTPSVVNKVSFSSAKNESSNQIPSFSQVDQKNQTSNNSNNFSAINDNKKSNNNISTNTSKKNSLFSAHSGSTNNRRAGTLSLHNSVLSTANSNYNNENDKKNNSANLETDEELESLKKLLEHSPQVASSNRMVFQGDNDCPLINQYREPVKPNITSGDKSPNNLLQPGHSHQSGFPDNNNTTTNNNNNNNNSSNNKSSNKWDLPDLPRITPVKQQEFISKPPASILLFEQQQLPPPPSSEPNKLQQVVLSENGVVNSQKVINLDSSSSEIMPSNTNNSRVHDLITPIQNTTDKQQNNNKSSSRKVSKASNVLVRSLTTPADLASFNTTSVSQSCPTNFNATNAASPIQNNGQRPHAVQSSNSASSPISQQFKHLSEHNNTVFDQFSNINSNFNPSLYPNPEGILSGGAESSTGLGSVSEAPTTSIGYHHMMSSSGSHAPLIDDEVTARLEDALLLPSSPPVTTCALIDSMVRRHRNNTEWPLECDPLTDSQIDLVLKDIQKNNGRLLTSGNSTAISANRSPGFSVFGSPSSSGSPLSFQRRKRKVTSEERRQLESLGGFGDDFDICNPHGILNDHESNNSVNRYNNDRLMHDRCLDSTSLSNSSHSISNTTTFEWFEGVVDSCDDALSNAPSLLVPVLDLWLWVLRHIALFQHKPGGDAVLIFEVRKSWLGTFVQAVDLFFTTYLVTSMVACITNGLLAISDVLNVISNSTTSSTSPFLFCYPAWTSLFSSVLMNLFSLPQKSDLINGSSSNAPSECSLALSSLQTEFAFLPNLSDTSVLTTHSVIEYVLAVIFYLSWSTLSFTSLIALRGSSRSVGLFLLYSTIKFCFAQTPPPVILASSNLFFSAIKLFETINDSAVVADGRSSEFAHAMQRELFNRGGIFAISIMTSASISINFLFFFFFRSYIFKWFSRLLHIIRVFIFAFIAYQLSSIFSFIFDCSISLILTIENYVQNLKNSKAKLPQISSNSSPKQSAAFAPPAPRRRNEGLRGIFSSFISGLETSSMEPHPFLDSYFAPWFAEECSFLGGLYLRIASYLSTRPDCLPPAWIERLSKVRPMPLSASDVCAVLDDHARQVTKNPSANRFTLFSSIAQIPVSTTVVTQSHRARVTSLGAQLAGVEAGSYVIVKVKRPEIQSLLNGDSLCVDFGLRLLSLFSWSFFSPLIRLLKEWMTIMMPLESNLKAEVRNMQIAKVALEQNFVASLKVPTVYATLCTDDVIVLEACGGGLCLNDDSSLSARRANVSDVMGRVSFAVMLLALRGGILLVDVCPSTIRVKCSYNGSVKITLTDLSHAMSTTCPLSKENLNTQLAKLIVAIGECDKYHMLKLLTSKFNLGITDGSNPYFEKALLNDPSVVSVLLEHSLRPPLPASHNNAIQDETEAFNRVIRDAFNRAMNKQMPTTSSRWEAINILYIRHFSRMNLKFSPVLSSFLSLVNSLRGVASLANVRTPILSIAVQISLSCIAIQSFKDLTISIDETIPVKSNNNNNNNTAVRRLHIMNPRMSRSFVAAGQIGSMDPSLLSIRMSSSFSSRVSRLLESICQRGDALGIQTSALVSPLKLKRNNNNSKENKEKENDDSWTLTALECSAGCLGVSDIRAVRNDSFVPLLDASLVVLNGCLHLLHALGAVDLSEPIYRYLPDFIPSKKNSNAGGSDNNEAGDKNAQMINVKKRISASLVMSRVSCLDAALPSDLIFSSKSDLSTAWTSICEFIPSSTPPKQVVEMFCPAGSDYPLDDANSEMCNDNDKDIFFPRSSVPRDILLLAPAAVVAEGLASHVQAIILLMVAANAFSRILPADLIEGLTVEKDAMEIFSIGLTNLILIPLGIEKEIQWQLTTEIIKHEEQTQSAGICQVSNNIDAQLSSMGYSNEFSSTITHAKIQNATLAVPTLTLNNQMIFNSNNPSSSNPMVKLENPRSHLTSGVHSPTQDDFVDGVMSMQSGFFGNLVTDFNSDVSCSSNAKDLQTSMDLCAVNDNAVRICPPPLISCFASARALATFVSGLYWLEEADGEEDQSGGKDNVGGNTSKDSSKNDNPINKSDCENLSNACIHVGSLLKSESTRVSPLGISGSLLESYLRPTVIKPPSAFGMVTGHRLFGCGLEILSRTILLKSQVNALNNSMSSPVKFANIFDEFASNFTNAVTSILPNKQKNSSSIIQQPASPSLHQSQNKDVQSNNTIKEPLTPSVEPGASVSTVHASKSTPPPSATMSGINKNKFASKDTNLLTKSFLSSRMVIGFQSVCGGAMVLVWPLRRQTIVILSSQQKVDISGSRSALIKSICNGMDVGIPDALSR